MLFIDATGHVVIHLVRAPRGISRPAKMFEWRTWTWVDELVTTWQGESTRDARTPDQSPGRRD